MRRVCLRSFFAFMFFFSVFLSKKMNFKFDNKLYLYIYNIYQFVDA